MSAINSLDTDPLTLNLEDDKECSICDYKLSDLAIFNEGYFITPLHRIMQKNCAECLKKILDKLGSREELPELKTCPGSKTALHLAAESGSLSCLKLILPYLNIDELQRLDNDCNSPLFSAIINGNELCFQLLLDYYLETHIMNHNVDIMDHNMDIMKYAILNPLSGCSILHIAAKNGQKAIMKIILSSKYDNFRHIPGFTVDTQQTNRWTPLMFASSNGYMECVKFLVKKGANILHNGNGNFVFNNTNAIQLAKTHEIAEYLLQRAYPPTMTKSAIRTPSL